MPPSTLDWREYLNCSRGHPLVSGRHAVALSTYLTAVRSTDAQTRWMSLGRFGDFGALQLADERIGDLLPGVYLRGAPSQALAVAGPHIRESCRLAITGGGVARTALIKSPEPQPEHATQVYPSLARRASCASGRSSTSCSSARGNRGGPARRAA